MRKVSYLKSVPLYDNVAVAHCMSQFEYGPKVSCRNASLTPGARVKNWPASTPRFYRKITLFPQVAGRISLSDNDKEFQIVTDCITVDLLYKKNKPVSYAAGSIILFSQKCLPGNNRKHAGCTVT